MNVTCHSIALACWRKWRNGGPAPSTKHPAPSTQRKVRNAKVSASAQSTIDQSKKMPKIDTLDALDDEMTSILNTL